MQRTRGLRSSSSARVTATHRRSGRTACNGRRLSAVRFSSVFVMSVAESWMRFCIGRCPPRLRCQKARQRTACGHARAIPERVAGPQSQWRDCVVASIERRATLRMESPNQKAIRFPASCIDGFEPASPRDSPPPARLARADACHATGTGPLQLDACVLCHQAVSSPPPGRARRVLVRCPVLIDELDLSRASAVHEPLFCCFFRSRTPGPPPFSSMNSTPADSKARRSLFRASSETRGPRPASTLFTVGRDSPARAASFDWDQPSRPRAPRSCSIVSICKSFSLIQNGSSFMIHFGSLIGHAPKVLGVSMKEDIENGTERTNSHDKSALFRRGLRRPDHHGR